MRVGDLHQLSRRTFAFAKTLGGIILSGPKACRGSIKDESTCCRQISLTTKDSMDDAGQVHLAGLLALAARCGREGIFDSERHLCRERL